jgi:hypothetical protein
LALFGRRPPQRVDSLVMPASENLHNSRLMRRGKFRPIDQPVDADEYGSFGQSRFPKALDHQLRSF